MHAFYSNLILFLFLPSSQSNPHLWLHLSFPVDWSVSFWWSFWCIIIMISCLTSMLLCLLFCPFLSSPGFEEGWSERHPLSLPLILQVLLQYQDKLHGGTTGRHWRKPSCTCSSSFSWSCCQFHPRRGLVFPASLTVTVSTRAINWLPTVEPKDFSSCHK